ncbi:MAG TPA: hypothetical protein PKC40_07050 [Saprospiraceae bacterium]|nr:hypothetical protein [Saprospiraceae bacterium]HMU05862.1 hypothetical protein [Saprospiraceae bacterium]
MNKNIVWVSNHEIHKEADISINEFIKKIICIEGLRTNELKFSFYPDDKKDYDDNLNLWDYINENRNSLNLDNHYYFNIGFPLDLYSFLRHSKKETILNAIALRIAGIIIFFPEQKKDFQKELYPPVFSYSMELIDKYFKNLLIEKRKPKTRSDHHRDIRVWYAIRDTFETCFRELVGNSIIHKYVSTIPFSADNSKIKWKLILPTAYLNKTDWNKIVIEDGFDDLNRRESRFEPLEKWKNDLKKYYKNLKYLDEL